MAFIEHFLPAATKFVREIDVDTKIVLRNINILARTLFETLKPF